MLWTSLWFTKGDDARLTAEGTCPNGWRSCRLPAVVGLRRPGVRYQTFASVLLRIVAAAVPGGVGLWKPLRTG